MTDHETVPHALLQRLTEGSQPVRKLWVSPDGSRAVVHLAQECDVIEARELIEAVKSWLPPQASLLLVAPRTDVVVPELQGHWLVRDDDGQIVGCHCGFEADREADLGYGDSVVEHLVEVGRDIERCHPEWVGSVTKDLG